MLPYLWNPRVGAACYNLSHNYALPLGLLAFAGVTRNLEIVPYALIWTAHIGMDRMFGYGLKYPEAFSETHLGTLGQNSAR
jgi:hypothetical protein